MGGDKIKRTGMIGQVIGEDEFGDFCLQEQREGGENVLASC